MPTESEYRTALLHKAMLPGALGAMEDLAVRLAMMGSFNLEQPELLLFCADHGVTKEGVTHSATEISFQMARSFAHGNGVSGLFCSLNHIALSVIDVGLDSDQTDPLLVDRKIARGTRDFLQEEAMTEEQCARALEIGSDEAGKALGRGCDILLFGEMGVGNSASASAILSRRLGVPASLVTGSASKLGSAELAHKIQVIEQALSRHPARDGFSLLCSFGGFETAAIAGGMIRASREGLPILLDGLITYAAALCACAMDASVPRHLIAGHRSASPGSDLVLKTLGLTPVLDLGMQLGEGSGAAAAWPVVRLASHLFRDLKEFGDLGVTDSTRHLKELGIL
jgi:nicotinate-nucleotide--dimethylbenzimidazole phosphoribosyltransferase